MTYQEISIMTKSDVDNAYILRALISISNAWENNEHYTIDDMNKHLEVMIDVVDGVTNFDEFIDNTGLKDVKHS